ncbi:SET domain-containing protein SmydA-8-like [Tribolium madens]|uniref:SET domain-containing protein SmydA-8-like n=1 Tax=Tribolium madens TaxID=41895 RepID=UPI001CF72357|nr:SET domain-containing protein SmydA-8-like [Tribolium madens]
MSQVCANKLPFMVKRDEVLGRCIVATRDIQPGEVITESLPLIVGPKMASPPLCLGCHKKLALAELRYDCSKCFWPLCGQACENLPLHQAECEIFAKAGYKPTVKNDNTKQTVYCSIAPLRALLLKQNSPEEFKLLLDFQSHLEEHEKTQIYQVLKKSLVPFFTQVLKLDTNEREILTICSIFDTNCFEVRDTQRLVNIRGLYPLISFLSHNCKHNTKHCFINDNFRLVLTASTSIKEGELITTTYTQTLWGTLSRRSHLKMAKHFDCLCERCTDPTEFGTYLSAVNCNVCGDGSKVTSCDPLNSEANWHCEKCGFVITGGDMVWGNEVLQKELTYLDKKNPESLEEFLERYAEVLHPRNSYSLQVKYALCQIYGNLDGFKLEELSLKLIDRKIELCKELLEIAEVLEPGQSWFRGLLLYDLFEALVTKDERRGKEIEEETKNYLMEAAEIFNSEPDMRDNIQQKLKNL